MLTTEEHLWIQNEVEKKRKLVEGLTCLRDNNIPNNFRITAALICLFEYLLENPR